MRSHFAAIFNPFTMVTLIAALVGSLVQVTPVYAASIVVNSNADTVANDGVCTLREAIIAATSNLRSGSRAGECAAGSAAGVDSISFVSNYTITMGSQLPFITTPMTITGRGTGNTIIQAAASPNVATWHVFQVTPTGTLTLDGVTVRHGRCNGSCTVVGNVEPDSGGGIYNAGTLTVMNSAISGNNARDGAGIMNLTTLTVTNSIIAGNNAIGDLFSQGGGIYNEDTLTVTNSTFSGNTSVYGGGGLFNIWIANVTGSTFSGNSVSAGEGGGIYNIGLVRLTNSTLSGNTAPVGGGGGIYNYVTDNLFVTNSTIAGNSAIVGGGIYLFGEETSPALNNTIISNNGGGNCSGLGIFTNGSNNLDSGNTCGWGTSNGSKSNVNPLLGPLTNNGGPTQTMHLQAFSPAIDAGNASICSASPVNGVDQRGVTRPLGAGCDIGAYESMNGGGPDSAGVFRPSNGLLYLKHLNMTGFADLALNYGISLDYPVVGDWDADGDTTIGVYRNSYFYLRNSNTVGFADEVIQFGNPGDQPIAGDWNGNGSETIGVFRPSTGQFLLRNSLGPGPAQISFFLGNPGDVAIAGDWDGDGDDTVGVFRPSNGIIFLKNTNETGFADIALNYGIPGDKPVVGDWNADGIDTIGVYRNGQFLLRNSNTVGFADIGFALGIPGDMPIAGNWDGHP